VSLKPAPIQPVPEETVRVARAVFRKGNPYLGLRDEIGTIFADADFADLFPTRGQPGLPPWRLALVTILQFREDLPDRQAAEAVRARIDWKYLLGLELTDSGFDPSVLCEFRARLVADSAEERLLHQLLEACQARGLLKARGRQRTDATHVLAAIRTLNRLELVGETLRAALNELAAAAPAWLLERSRPEWLERYAARVDVYRLPKTEAGREALAATIGADGYDLLAAVFEPQAPAWLRTLPAVETLRQVWIQQFCVVDDQVRWRRPGELPPPGRRLPSPYDPEAVCGTKRGRSWIGYKVHLTETCDVDQPHLIVDVRTTTAAATDNAVTGPIHRALAARGLLPCRHLVDSGYIDAGLLVASRAEHGIELIGPARPDTSWLQHAGAGFDIGAFTIDWEAREARCPQGQTSIRWTVLEGPAAGVAVRVAFDPATCQAGPCRASCTRSKTAPRTLALLPRAQHEAMQARRREQRTDAWKQVCAPRAGVEGLLSQGVRAFGLRRSRYIGHAKTHLQHVLTALAINIVRLDAWLRGIAPATTRRSRLAALMAAPA
jgi:transposase